MNFKKIDLDHYPRREHFKHFLSMENPFISVTFKCEITDWISAQKNSGLPFFLSFQYAVVHAANRVREFRQRIMDGEIIEYDFSNPSYTVMLPDRTFRFCSVNANIPYNQYLDEAKSMQEKVSTEELTESDTLSLLFISCSPWFDYESLNLARPNRVSSNPNITWGKYTKENKLYIEDGKIMEKEVYTMPITIMVNHSLVDAIHISDFITYLNEELDKMIKNEFKCNVNGRSLLKKYEK